ncbi:MAG TPA: hypothetical protein VGZ90_13365 [Puia sp.]|jgi:hypothetical protein|nr:hypothetical protein [Puia sp.]
MVTLGRLSEEILLLLSGGRIGAGTKFSIEEVRISICQVANQLLKIEMLTADIPMGNVIPSGAAIGTYEKNLVVQYKTKSKTTLPCFPLKLPRNMGVFQIFDPANPYNEFIPVELGQASMIQGNPILSNLSGFTGYECAGMDVLFTKDITTPNTPVYVTMRLVVLDFSLYGDWDILPLAPDMEFQIKNEVVKLYSSEPIADKTIDSGTKEQKGIPLKVQEQP